MYSDLSLEHFSTTSTAHQTVGHCYYLPAEVTTKPVQWEPELPRCYSLGEVEERVFSPQIDRPANLNTDLEEIEVSKVYSLESADLIGHGISVNAADLRTRQDPKVVQYLHKFGFLTDQEYQRKLRQIEGLPSEEEESSEEEEVKEPLLVQLMGGEKAVLDYKEFQVVDENILDLTPEPSDKEKPFIFTFSDYVMSTESLANRYATLGPTESRPEEPWKIPSQRCIGSIVYNLLEKRPFCRVTFPDPMDLRYFKSIQNLVLAKHKAILTLEKSTLMVAARTTEEIDETLCSIWLACKRYTIRHFTLSFQKVAFCQKWYKDLLEELQTLTKTEIKAVEVAPEAPKPKQRPTYSRWYSDYSFSCQSEEDVDLDDFSDRGGFDVQGRRPDVDRAVEALYALGQRMEQITLTFPKYIWQQEFISTPLLEELSAKFLATVTVLKTRLEWVVKVTGLKETSGQAEKELIKYGKKFNEKIYYLANDLSKNGWTKEDPNWNRTSRTFRLDMILLKKKEIEARIMAESALQHIDFLVYTRSSQQNCVKCYGAEEELFKAGWALDKVIAEYQALKEEFIDLVQKSFSGRMIGPGGAVLKQLETETGCVYASVITQGNPKLLVRGSEEALAKAKAFVEMKITEFMAEDAEKLKKKEEERLKRQQEWEEKQKLKALRNRRHRPPAKK